VIGLDDFRHVLGHFASGVTVVTARDAQGRPVGLTASAFTSVSLVPPLVLVCVDVKARCYPALQAADRFAVNILGVHQEELSQRFASNTDDKFEGLAHDAGGFGLPILPGALAHVECAKVGAHPGGDHTIFVGRVEVARAHEGEPLLHYRGRYDRLLSARNLPRRNPSMPVPLSRPPKDDEIKRAALAAIESGQYILGPECRGFEAEFARYIGCRHAVLTNSGTAALWMAMKALGVKGGDEVLVPSHTAFPTAEAVLFADAVPVFVDIDETYTIDPKDAAAKVTARTVGIVPVHLYGHPANIDAVQDLAAQRGLWMLEDCCQAHGAAYRGRRVGTFGRAAAFSFYPSKNLTVMGDGGALLTDDDEIAARCRRLRDHGRLNKDVHAELGFNLRFNDVQAAIGRVLLRRLDAMNDRRRELAARYTAALGRLPLELPQEQPGGRHVYHLYVIRTARRAELAAFLNERGIQTGIHYPVPCHRQPAVERLSPPALPRTERATQEILSLPMSAGHSDAEIDQVTAAVQEFFAR
jgi:dTDP-4-amino-4,6-dideoxygalactose transaminase/flavin reductase (DIM6/NTAB) family NADH-FMN oxidoreductase RutF